MFERLKGILSHRPAQKEKKKRRPTADPTEALRWARDNTWAGGSTDARRNHPGFGSAPYGAGRK